MNGMKHPMENFALRRNGLERGLALVRMARASSQEVRGNLSWKERHSTWKVSLLTGRTAQTQHDTMEQ